MEKILIVDDNESMLYTLSNVITDAGYLIQTANSGTKAIEEINNADYSLVILDYILPDKDGIHILNQIKSLKPDLPVIMLTAFGDIKNAVDAMKKGADDYITKPFDNREMIIAIQKVLKNKYIKEEFNLLQEKFNKSYYRSEIIVSSDVMKEIFNQVKIVAPTNMTVLLQGESGSGKEVIASSIHKLSNRNDGPFIAVDCGAIPDSLFESELFGYEKGAFTDAKSSKAGKFELAQKGTLFLDEILNLSDANQIKLLRVIEDRKVTRLGGNNVKDINVRIITASNSNLIDSVNNHTFRADLYYRLNEFELIVPPLRRRKEDIPDLIKQFIKDANSELNKEVSEIDDIVLKNLIDYSWPGNIRELRNVIRKAVLLSGGKVINSIDFILNSTSDYHKNSESNEESFDSSSKQAEKEIIIDALNQNNWNKTKAAKMLKMNLRTFYRKIKILDISNDGIMQ